VAGEPLGGLSSQLRRAGGTRGSVFVASPDGGWTQGLGDTGDPQPVRLGDGEVAVDQIRVGCCAGVTDRTARRRRR
jgi:hypothetical protein